MGFQNIPLDEALKMWDVVIGDKVLDTSGSSYNGLLYNHPILMNTINRRLPYLAEDERAWIGNLVVAACPNVS